MPKQNEQLRKVQELLKISKENINNNKQEFYHAISDTPTQLNSSYIAWKRLLQIKHTIKLIEATMTITTLTRNCTPLSISISNKELNLTNILTIFDKKKENIVDVDKKLKIIIMANRVEKVKKSLYKALDYYWDAPLDCSLITMLLDSCCKSMKKLDSWKRERLLIFCKKNMIYLALKMKKDVQKNFLILANLARKYLVIPSTSTSSKCLFLSVSNLMTAKRTSINTGLFERILFLKQNIGILDTIFESQLK
ncbi:6868_t:CDS:2 [Cetraspora pellucida]|uniref:6868_t:CDS:1 n=1 Tax=Cetraspora pellucida TaxID=1433469 RepID=A0A9N9ELD4_9GLOM|nr:6868_t:CDS:2 [Cetraspora pellucida]